MGVNITTIDCLRVLICFNHRNWVNHYFTGGGRPGIGHGPIRSTYAEASPGSASGGNGSCKTFWSGAVSLARRMVEANHLETKQVVGKKWKQKTHT